MTERPTLKDDAKWTKFVYWKDDEGTYRATEQRSTNNIVGQGQLPQDAIIDYCEQFKERN